MLGDVPKGLVSQRIKSLRKAGDACSAARPRGGNKDAAYWTVAASIVLCHEYDPAHDL